MTRYWRAIGLDAKSGGDLELSAFELYNSASRVDAPAALTCLHAPTVGILSALQDGNLATVVRWPRTSYAAASFALVWDFGSPTTITAARIGAGSSAALFSESFVLQSSTDAAVWTNFGPVAPSAGGGAGLIYPGANALTASIDSAAAFSAPVVRSQKIERLPVAAALDEGPIFSRVLPGVRGLLDREHGGLGRVLGTVKIKGSPDAPAYSRVRLYRERDGLLLREQFSDPITGAYDFRDIDVNQACTVITYDHLKNFLAVIADNITPEPMP